MWWGGFLLGGLMLILVSIPFFSFPKVLTREKEKIKMMERQPTGNQGTSNATTNNNSNNSKIPNSNSYSTKNDTGYGKDIKGLPYFYFYLKHFVEFVLV